MSPPDGNPMPLDHDQSISPSPARDSLINTLGASTADGTPTLKKRRSWVASLRDAVSKSALTAKAAVDAFRGGDQSSKPEHEPDANTTPFTCTEAAPDLVPRASFDSIASSKAPTISSTTSLQPQHGRHRSLASRVATASLRNHLRKHSNGQSKRGSLYSMGTKDGGDSIACPEDFVTPPASTEDITATSKRYSTRASSIVGSIRGMRRKRESYPPMLAPYNDTPITQQARQTVLPSSPIDIPEVAPTAPSLDLDLGPSGLMMSVPRSKDVHDGAKLMKEAMEASVSTASSLSSDPQPVAPFNPNRRRGPCSISFKPVQPRDVLHINSRRTSFASSIALPAPRTPMPGTTFTLDVEGSGSEPELFERSVTPSNTNSHKGLRSMQSLDAMAESCTIAHSNDEEKPPISGSTHLPLINHLRLTTPLTTTLDHPAEPITTSLKVIKSAHPECLRNLASAETVHTLPVDFPALHRQKAPPPEQQDDKPRNAATDEERKTSLEDPFHDSHVYNSGPPSPVRSVALPFRPKDSDTAASMPGRVSDSVSDQDEVGLEPSVPIDGGSLLWSFDSLSLQQGSTTAAAPRVMEERGAVESDDEDEEDIEARYKRRFRWEAERRSSQNVDILGGPLASPESEVNSPVFAFSDADMVTAYNAIPTDAQLLTCPHTDSSLVLGPSPSVENGRSATHQVTISEEDDAIQLPNYFDALEAFENKTPRSSTDTTRARASTSTSRGTHTAGLRENQHRFSFESWLRDSPAANANSVLASVKTATSIRKSRQESSLDSTFSDPFNTLAEAAQSDQTVYKITVTSALSQTRVLCLVKDQYTCESELVASLAGKITDLRVLRVEFSKNGAYETNVSIVMTDGDAWVARTLFDV